MSQVQTAYDTIEQPEKTGVPLGATTLTLCVYAGTDRKEL
jgi:hypothetical protein